jgi:hypothetical protein
MCFLLWKEIHVSGLHHSIASSSMYYVAFQNVPCSIVLPKSRRSRNNATLRDTNNSVLEVNKAQVVLRSLSTLTPPEEGVAGGVAVVDGRPDSTDTACLEYQDVISNR